MDNYNTHRRIPPCLIDDGGALFETFFATGDLRNDIVEIRSRRLDLCLKKVLEMWVTFGLIGLLYFNVCKSFFINRINLNDVK